MADIANLERSRLRGATSKVKQQIKVRRKKEAEDDSIMGTNNSSIVSKRSVERLYYPEPHFFRYFVKKPQRRAPVINRGYWFRMYAIERTVDRFLSRNTIGKTKVIINLGCGDPLPFQLLAKNDEKLGDVIFVDVDYPDLIRKKAQCIAETPQLYDLLSHASYGSTTGAPGVSSDKYHAVGCDLRDLDQLQTLLERIVRPTEAMVLMTAEVSITYMDPDAADNLIKWAAALDDATFCLLEQYLPDGPDHPFAQTMIKHFNRLQTPLKSINRYPTLYHQQQRFRNNGWQHARCRSLWALWGDERFIMAEERLTLNSVEPFDEWEEFALFASHYVFLIAATCDAYLDDYLPALAKTESRQLFEGKEVHTEGFSQEKPIRAQLVQHSIIKSIATRDRVEISGDPLSLLAHLDKQGKHLLDCSAIGSFSALSSSYPRVTSNEPSLPSGCTITQLDARDLRLLAGGRKSPSVALQNCWVKQEHTRWTRTSDLPVPLYRHSATDVDIRAKENSLSGVLLYGGRSTKGCVQNGWFLWTPPLETDTNSNWAGGTWQQLACTGDQLEPRFGATFASIGGDRGVLMGGMSEDGHVLGEVYEWVLSQDTAKEWAVKVDNITSHVGSACSSLCRFGATLTWCEVGWVLAGGVVDHRLLPRNEEILEITPVWREEVIDIVPQRIALDLTMSPSRPFLIGHYAAAQNGNVIISGGGAVCFSFGSCLNQKLWSLGVYDLQDWDIHEEQGRADSSDSPVQKKSPMKCDGPLEPALMVDRVVVKSDTDFERIIANAQPVLIEGLSLGACTSLWTLDYLKNAIESDREVVVHESQKSHMSFSQKNFTYVTKHFATFINEILPGGASPHQYLRSLAVGKPADQPANFFKDYPELSADVQIPPELRAVKDNMHSSVLRVAGDINMWLHYDVMANILIPMSTPKCLFLYPPKSISSLSFPPGSTTSTMDPTTDDAKAYLPQPLIAYLDPTLAPGRSQVLYIPPLWAHAALPPSEMASVIPKGFDNTAPSDRAHHSIALNIFFRPYSDEMYAAGRDIYGNRDLRPYEQGRGWVNRIIKSMRGLHPDARGFYTERLVDELRESLKDKL
ncbi:tRNA methyltransferase ppm2 [Agyrium rufum]|nr:tRNA methyltransferase ppm2 [Agyrium rufum]